VDEVVGKVVGRSSNPIYPIYHTLVVKSQNLSSKPASFLIRNANKAVLWLIGGAFVAYGGQELLTHTSVEDCIIEL
jgi:hypothetical protein